MGRGDIYPGRMSEVGCHCSGILLVLYIIYNIFLVVRRQLLLKTGPQFETTILEINSS